MNTPPQQPTSRSNSRSTIGIVTAIVGGIVLLVAGASVAIAAITNFSSGADGEDRTLTLTDTDGVKGITADVAAANFTVEFADITDVELDVTNASGNGWSLERRADQIFVDSHRGFFSSFCLFNCGWSNETVTLTLPEALEGHVNADLSLGSGAIFVWGDFVALDLDISAGQITAEGAARSVDTQVSAGRAELRLDNVSEASFEVSAGKVDAELTGRAPEHIDIDVSAGGLSLTVPDRPYQVQSDVSAGSFVNNLRTDPSSRNTIIVDVSAGEVRLDIP